MPLSHLPASLANAFCHLAHWLDRRTAAPPARCCCSASSSPPDAAPSPPGSAAAGITDDFRQGYVTVCAVGRARRLMAISTVLAVRPLLRRPRLTRGHRRHAHRALRPRGRRLPASTTTPPPARPARSTSTATSGSPWPPWPSTPTGAPSPCPCRPNCTSARRDLAKLPPERRARLPHQAGAGRRAVALAEAVGGDRLRGTLGGGRWRLRQEAVPEARPRRPASRWSAACARTRPCGRCRCPSRPASPARRRPTARNGSAWPSGPGSHAAGNRSSACSTASG